MLNIAAELLYAANLSMYAYSLFRGDHDFSVSEFAFVSDLPIIVG
jgi:hypothetical protein